MKAELEKSDDPSAEEGDNPAPVDSGLSPLEQKVARLEMNYSRVWRRLGDATLKIFAVQHTVVEVMGQTVCELGAPGADIFPVEQRSRPDAPVRVIAFGSMGQNFGLQPKEFFKSFVDRDVDILFLKDFRGAWYQRGLLGLTKNVPETAEYLRKLVKDDPRPIVTVGASAGGFAAILFGAMLGARKVVAFSPQTHVTNTIFNRFKNYDSELAEIDFNSNWTNLRSVLEANPFAGQMDIYFADRAPYDSDQAKNLEGLPGVNLHCLSWNGHNTASFLRSRNKLDAVLGDLCQVSN